MKAVILVGGEGTRLRPLTYDLPKPMVPIVNKPFMEHLVDYLVRYGFDEIIFAQGYKSEAFQSYFADGSRWGARFHHAVEDFPLDTAGPVKNVERLLGPDPFLVLNGDVLADLDLGALLDLHRRLEAAATLALTPVDDPSAYGVVVTDGDHRVQAFIEKPPRDQAPTNAINAGVYVLEPSVLRFMPAGERHSFERQFFPTLVREGEKLCAAVCPGYWLDIGSPARYLQANRDVLSGAVRVELPPSPDGERQWIGAGSRIDPGAALDGPLWIGEGCVVERGACLEGPLVLGARCHVGADARVRGSVIWDDCRLGAATSVQDALVGRRCTLGAGAVLEPHAVLGSGQALEARAALTAGARLPAG